MVELTVSRPVRIFALVALLVTVAGAGMLLVTGKQAPKPPVTVVSRSAAAAAKAHAPKVHPAAVPAPPTPTAAKAKPKPAVVVHKPKPTLAANGLPMPLALALQQHRIVVVSFVDPQSRTDSISYAEARAGARDASVGFLLVSVLNDAVAGPWTALLPGGQLLPEPGVLIYRRPNVLIQRIDGFADRTAVAQAAVAAATAPPLGAAPTTP
jgi:hypothetical protein